MGWWSPTIIRGDDREAVHIPNHKFTVNVVRNLTQKTHWRIKTHLAVSHLDVRKINVRGDLEFYFFCQPTFLLLRRCSMFCVYFMSWIFWGYMFFEQNIVADMRKVLAKNPQVEQKKLHRRVFLDNVNPENQALLVSLFFGLWFSLNSFFIWSRLIPGCSW